MTSANRPDVDSSGMPKSTWGPGKNAALSVIAFALIFGLSTYVRRDTEDKPASAPRNASGLVEVTVSTSDELAPASTPKAASAPDALAQAKPEAEPEVKPDVKPEVKPATAPHVAAATHARPSHSPSAAMSAGGSIKRKYDDRHRHQRTEALASARKHTNVAAQPQRFSGDSAYVQSTSVTHEDLEGARALARARACARIDQWICVEENASRTLAIDPQNSESRALLEQAIRNRP